MANIDPCTPRIIVPASDERPALAEAHARRFDYAALARRRAARRLATPSGESGPAAAHDSAVHAQDGHGDASATGHDDAQDDTTDTEALADGNTTAAVDARATLAAHEALLRRLPPATMPAVDALFRTQGHFIELARTLAREVAAFCGDPAIGEAGNWEAYIPLDARLLPGTTLYLSLSHFRLSLRFDTGGIETRQLLLDHSAMLERELDALLRAWGAPRDIELTVW